MYGGRLCLKLRGWMPLLGLGTRNGSSEMPHLHLPIDHTDADLVLAANLAEVVGSEDLYVAWSHESGAGAVPEVEAVLVEADNPPPGFLATVAASFAAFWRTITGRQAGTAVTQAHNAGPARHGAGEPSV
jgi:hypothetical protein